MSDDIYINIFANYTFFLALSARDFYSCVDDELSFDLFLRYIEDRKTIIEFYSELLIDKKSVNICF